MDTKENTILMTKCSQYAMNYINHFPKTKKELVARLYEKWYSEHDVTKTMDFLESKNFVNDQMFAESYINSEVIKKWKPFWVIKQKLWQKWVDKSILEDIFYEKEKEIVAGMIWGIKNDIKKYKRKWVEWFDIIQKILRKWYKLDHVKEALNTRAQEDS